MIIPIGAAEGMPFSRIFFSVYLEDLYKRADCGGFPKLSLYLLDGTTLDVCQIEELSETYLVVRAYGADERLCELSLNAIPYALIYRVELGRRAGEDQRVGFQWKRVPTKD